MSVDRKTQSLHLETNEIIRYERLILAPGGRPIIPRLEGADTLAGIFPVRNLPEAKRTHDWLTKEHRVIVLGGGLVGVKTAAYLMASGFRVSIVEKEDHLLPLALTSTAARFIEEHLRRLGIDLFLGKTLQRAGGENGILKSVVLGGKSVPCDTLLIAAGSVPNVAFLDGSGLLENGKLLVSSRLQSRDPKIFAAGDAVTIETSEGGKITPWTWPQAVSQGRLAAGNLYHPQPLPLKTLTRPNSMNLQGLSLVMLGAAVKGSEEISYARKDEGVLRQAFLRNGRVTGGVLLGDISNAGPLHHLIISGKDSGSEAYDLIQASNRAMPRELLVQGIRRRRARFIYREEKKSC